MGIFCRRCGYKRGRQGARPEMNIDAKQRCKRAFALIDKNGNGTLSRIEVIKACRESEEVRRLLGLPQVIREEDGTRDAFEAIFQRFDKDNSKSITYDEFESTLYKDSIRSDANPRSSDSNAGRGRIEDGRK